MRNEALFAQLPNNLPARAPVHAHLLQYSATGEGAVAWSFIYAPESFTTTKNARYTASNIVGGLPATEYGGEELRTVTMSGLIVDGYYDGKNLSGVIEGLERLTKAAVGGQANAIGEAGDGFTFASPPVLSFVLGGRVVIAPCVLVSTSRQEVSWFGDGSCADATIDMTLQEVSVRDLVE